MKLSRNIHLTYFLIQTLIWGLIPHPTHAGRVTYVEVDGKKILFIQIGCPINPETGQRYDEPWCNPLGLSSQSALSGAIGSFLGDGTTLGSMGQVAGMADGIFSVHSQHKAIAEAHQAAMMRENYHQLDALKNRHEAHFESMRSNIQERQDQMTSEFNEMVRSTEQATSNLRNLTQLLDSIQVGPVDRAGEPQNGSQQNPVNPRLGENLALAEANQDQVTQNVNQLEQLLPKVTPQIGRVTSNYIRAQLRSSENIARVAVDLAQAGASTGAIQLLGDFAINTTASMGRFMGGVLAGTYQGLLTPAEVALAIYSDPNLILNLSVHIMNTITAGPGAVADAVHHAFQHIENAMYEFNMTMAYGTAEERGFALGELGANILLTMGGAEVSQATRVAFAGVAAKVGRNEALGTALNQSIRASEALAPELTATDRMIEQGRDAVRRNLQVYREVRTGYRNAVNGITETAQRMIAEGHSEEVVARHVHELRREIGIRYKEMTPPEVRQYIYDRNIVDNSDIAGPSIEKLRLTKSWREIIESASRTNGKINRILEMLGGEEL